MTRKEEVIDLFNGKLFTTEQMICLFGNRTLEECQKNGMKMESITGAQIQNLTGMGREHARQTIDDLIKEGKLKKKEGRPSYSYQLIK